MAGLHGVGGDAGGFDDGGVDGVVVEDLRHGVDGLGELAADDVDHGAGLPGEANTLMRGGARMRCRSLMRGGRWGLAEVGVGAGDPVLAGWGEDVVIDGVFEGFGGVGKVAGDDEELAGADGLFDGGTFFSEDEEEGSLFDVGDLFIGVLVAGDEGSLLEDDAGEHGLGAVDELAGEEGVELLGGDVGPTGVEGLSGHPKRVPRVREKGTCGVRVGDVEWVGVKRMMLARDADGCGGCAASELFAISMER